VRRLRVLGPPADSLATRRSMERALAGVDLTPRELSPSAIVCVRRLRAERAREHVGGWADRLQCRIAGMVAAGARPSRDVVPADAPAVVFEDEAELLACLARDWRSGTGATWWWTGLFGGPANAEIVRRVFLAHARFVPATIELLHRSRQVSEVVRALSDDVCVELERAVAAAFGVPALSPPGLRPIHAGDEPQTDAVRGDQNVPSELLARAATVVSLQGDAVVLSSAQRRFMSVALLVRRAPVLAWTPGLVSALHQLLRSESIDSGNGEHQRAVEEPALIAAATPISTEVLAPVASATAGSARAAAVEAPGGDGDGATPSAETISPAPVIAAAAKIDAPVRASEREGPTNEPVRLPEPSSEPVQTSFGGVFYLVNLAIQLEIYGDFTQPAGRNPEVPLGRFLARIAERACGEAIREDAIWPALAGLAGDDEELSAWESGAPIDRAIDGMWPDLAELAAHALDLPEGDALEFLCRTPGRVLIGRTRLDVFFGLASHPIAIRVAGFDRNPGWVPIAGRVISFHYD
jgi:hypothetical protein